MAAETETEMPSSVDLAEAVAMMKGADQAESGELEADVDSADSQGDVATEELEDDRPGERIEAENVAPEFWSADDKVAWQDVPEHLRPILRKYEQQRTAFVNEKSRDAARAREEAVAAARNAASVVEQSAAWWRQNGPAIQRTFANRWSQVDWNKLASENPAEWTRLRQKYDDEAALTAEAHRRGQAEIAANAERARQHFLAARHSEHVKLAERMPEHFGPDRAQQTYEDLGRFLSAKGISTERINAIYEAPIIELALAAMRFDQAQKKASAVTGQAGTANTAVKTTSTRIVPGPAATAGNRTGDAARQAGERFRKSGGSSIADAAELIRLSGL